MKSNTHLYGPLQLSEVVDHGVVVVAQGVWLEVAVVSEVDPGGGLGFGSVILAHVDELHGLEAVEEGGDDLRLQSAWRV